MKATAVGWEDYVASLTELPRIATQSTDGGKLAYASALMLKVQEDRTHAGALIASLSNPWGDTVDATNPSTGYKAVWPRDFYQVAMAMAALGDRETPLAAFRYLPQVQVDAETPGNTGATGWFLQKTEVDGTLEWVGVQLDQTAMPLMLGWRLAEMGWLSQSRANGPVSDHDQARRRLPRRMAARSACCGMTSPSPRPSPSRNGGRSRTGPFPLHHRCRDRRPDGRRRHRPSRRAIPPGPTAIWPAADDYASKVEARMFTTAGEFGDGRYFMRLSPEREPQRQERPLGDNNGQPGQPKDRIIDGGFLELVRYGVRAADDEHILATLPEYDDQAPRGPLPRPLRLRSGQRRHPRLAALWQRRLWREYRDRRQLWRRRHDAGPARPGLADLHRRTRSLRDRPRRPANADDAALPRIRQTYVRGMERFANDGLLLPEQVWDGVGNPTPRGYTLGQGTDSATPLAWTHAEYIKLLRSLADRAVWDRYDPVADRYSRVNLLPFMGRDVGAQRRQGGVRWAEQDRAAAPHPSSPSAQPPSP